VSGELASLVHDLSPLSRWVFERLLQDDLVMGRIALPSESYHAKVDQENMDILNLHMQRRQLVEFLLYHDATDALLIGWQTNLRIMAQDALPKRLGVQWISSWISHLESQLNNYQCSGVWYLDFTKVFGSRYPMTIQRLVAYMLLQRVIANTFSDRNAGNTDNAEEAADPNLVPDVIITLDPAEAPKFAYIVGWVIYKLTKSDKVTMSHSKFAVMRLRLNALSTETVEYTRSTRAQRTNVIPGRDFMEFMYYFESVVLQLFEKHEEFGPNILRYIHKSLLNNVPLSRRFKTLLDGADQIPDQGLDYQSASSGGASLEQFDGELDEEDRRFLYERVVSIYMRSRQKSWRSFHDYIPEKGTASLREDLKAMRADTQKSEVNKERKLTSMKKSNLLAQLQVWAQLECAGEAFSKVFLVSDILWLLWAFGETPSQRRKKTLVPVLLEHLRGGTAFSQEALARERAFAME